MHLKREKMVKLNSCHKKKKKKDWIGKIVTNVEDMILREKSEDLQPTLVSNRIDHIGLGVRSRKNASN